MEKALRILEDIADASNEDKYFNMSEGELKAYFNEAIAELKEAMKPKTCKECKGFVRDDYCSIIDDDCRVVMERCNGCKQFEPKDKR